MFGSISIAPPNSVVTSSFTATGPCTVGILEAEAVRINGQQTLDRTLILAQNDKVDLDVKSGPASAHRFIEWTFNGNTCHFAIASSSGTNRPTLRSKYRYKTWVDYTAPAEHLLTAMASNGNQSNITKTYTESSTLTVDTACFFESPGNYTYFCRSDVNNISRRIDHASKPISQTRIWNNSNQTWETYVLCEDGFIDKISYLSEKTRSTLKVLDAKCIFSDGVTLYVGGINKVVVLSDFNNTARVVAVDGTIVNGVALADTVLISTTDGRLKKLVNNTTSDIITGSMIGAMTTFKGQFIVPLTEEYTINVYDNTGVLVSRIDTGDYLPFAAIAGRNTMAVSAMDSRDVMVFADTSTAPIIKTFSTKVTFAVPVGDGFVASHYLSTYDTTVPPNPVVTGLNWPRWLAPVGASTGTGEYKITTVGENLKVTSAPSAGLLVDGATNVYLAKDQTSIALFTRAHLGSVATAVAIGNFAFDFKVDAQESSAFTTSVNVPPLLYTNKAIYSFTVSEKAVNAPIALSHGTIKINGSDYNGRSPLNAGDTIQITINVPQTRSSYYSVLSLADSQFPLVISSAVNTILDTKRFVEYGATGVESVIKIRETGTFYFPDYYDAKVFKGEEELVFPTTLQLDDELRVVHIRASQWWLDPRDTVIMGPTINHIVRNSTTVDDVPDEVDFGIVEIGIPDFEFPAPLEPSISGLSDGYEAEIFSEYMSFSINGGAWIARPKVKNGDKVRVLYRVKNLFETMWAKTLLADGVTNYEWGYLNINPALGEWVPARDNIDLLNTNWMRLQGRVEDASCGTAQRSHGTVKMPLASVGRLFQSSVSKSTTRLGLMSSSAIRNATASRGTDMPSASYKEFNSSSGLISATRLNLVPQSAGTLVPPTFFVSNYTTGQYQNSTFKSATMSQPTYNDDSDFAHQILLKHEMEAAFGRQGTFTRFTPLYQHETTLNPTVIPQYFSYQNILAEQIAEVIWSMETPPTVFSALPVYENSRETSVSANTFWIKTSSPFRDVIFAPTIIGTSFVIRNLYPRAVEQESLSLVSLPGLYSIDALVHATKRPNPVSDVTIVRMDIIQPTFVTNKPHQNVIEPVFNTPSLGKASMFSSPSGHQTAVYHAAGTMFDSETYVANNDNMGGYETEAEALAAAAEYSFGVPVMAYRQPEGTFSFVFQRPTALFCPIKGTNIYATQWLIGGG